MGKEEFAQLLETMMNDGEVAGRVANGDFTDLADGELTESERALLSAAGGDLDGDVSGFSGDFYIKLGDIDGESWKVGTVGSDGYLKIEMENVRGALGYLKLGDIKGE